MYCGLQPVIGKIFGKGILDKEGPHLFEAVVYFRQPMVLFRRQHAPQCGLQIRLSITAG